MKLTPNLLIFDFFGVICSEIAPFWLERHYPPDVAASVKADIVAKADRGEISAEDMFTSLASITGTEADVVRREWLELARIDRAMPPIIRALGKRYRVALLSNAPGEFLRCILERESLYDYFEDILISSEVCVAKPDVRIYQTLLERLCVAPEQALMIDDNPNNLTGAAAAGIPGYLFTTADEFLDYINAQDEQRQGEN